MSIPKWFEPGVWGIVIGAAGAMIIGFNWGGWVTGATAQEMASDSAEKAVVAAYTPICVANAKRAGADALAKLKAESSWERGEYVIKAGWVGKLGKTYREAVAEACAPKVVDSMKTDVKSS